MTGQGDNTTSWLNFLQQPVDQGGLGLNQAQASGVVGNLQNESGQSLSPWGPTGDNNSAWGTAQWRGDRLAALKQAYPDSYQTTESQQQFLRSEMLGSENSAYKALLTAKSPEEAARAVNHLYERSADTSGRREASARALMDQFGGGGAPDTGALSFANTSTGNKPVADPTTNQDGALSAPQALGPGSLFSQIGSAGVDANGNDHIAQGLIGMGAALSGISSPQQAQALNAQLAALKKQSTDTGQWTPHVLPNGQVMMVNSKNPALTRLLPGNYAKEEDDPGEKAAKQENAKLDAQEEHDKYSKVVQAASDIDTKLADIQRMRNAVMNPNVTFGGAGDTVASAKNLAYSMGWDPAGLNDTQLTQQLATKAQLDKGKLLPGAISNYEDMLMSRGNGLGLDKTRGQNLQALDAQEAIYQNQKALAQEAMKYKDAHGKLDSGWDQYAAQYQAQHAPRAANLKSYDADGNVLSAKPASAAKPNTFTGKNGKTVTWSY